MDKISFSAGVPEADCITEIYRQTDRIPGSHATSGREAGRPSVNDKLHQEVSEPGISSCFSTSMNHGWLCDRWEFNVTVVGGECKVQVDGDLLPECEGILNCSIFVPFSISRTSYCTSPFLKKTQTSAPRWCNCLLIFLEDSYQNYDWTGNNCGVLSIA